MTGSRKTGVRILCFLLGLLCVLSLILPAFAVETGDGENQTYTTLIRMRPKKGSLPIGQMEDGTAVTVLDTKGDFYKVDCYDMIGYIAKSQIVHTENDEYYVNCQASSSETKRLTYTDRAEALELRHSLLELAKEQLGSRYVYGAARPGAFDCSGLTYYLYKQHGTSLLRRASQQLQNGIVVPKEAMQVGDLVFFRETGNYPADHVGIYVGNNKIIHASTKRGIEYADMSEGYCKDYFLCARRVIVTSAATALPMAYSRSISSSLIATSVSGRTV